MHALEEAAWTRAKDGVTRYVVNRGQLVRHPDTGQWLTEQVFSDSLVARLLEAHDKRYQRKSAMELTGKDGGPIETKETSALDRLQSRIDGIAARIGAGGTAGGTD